jgi:hypothetical protein
MVIAVASTAKAQLVNTKGQTIGKELKAKNKVVVAEVGKASSAPAEMKKAVQMGNMEGSISQVISTPPSSPRKHGRLLSPETRWCHRHVLSGMVANDTDESGSLVVVEELSDEDPLPSSELRLHIAIEVVCHLRMVQETRSLVDEELSLFVFLLH